MINKIRAFFRNLSIKKKIISYTYLVISPIMLVICGFLIYNNYEKMQNDSRETNLSHVQSLSDSVELIMQDVNDLSTYIAINGRIQEILTDPDPERLNMNSRLWSHEASIVVVENMMILKGYINSVALYPENGVVPHLSCLDKSSSYIQDFEAVRQTDIYKNALSKKGASIWNYMPKGRSDIYQASRNDRLIHSRVIFDTAKKTPLGYLVMGIPAEKVEKLCETVIQNDEEGVLIFNYEGARLCEAGILDEAVFCSLEESTFFQEDYKKRDKIRSNNGYDIFTYQASKTSPVVCKAVPSITVGGIFMEIAYMPLLLIIGIMIGLFPVLSLVSNIVTKPLGNVCKAMGQFRKGDFDQQLKVETGDEVGEVAAGFNEMVYDIKELIDKNYVMALKERESELATLQAQINPHFLYNTLDVLYWQASDTGNEEIAENIYALSQLFRLVLGQGKGSITVAGEGELVSRYLEIQKMRFSKKMDYLVDIESEIQKQQIPKLILQPFVENAVVHGISNVKNHCLITINGRKMGDYMEFIIRDTGVGMTKEQIEAVWREPNTSNSSGYKIGGYAIYNVKERLELKYRGDFVLRIESEEKKGTKVILKIPMEGIQ